MPTLSSTSDHFFGSAAGKPFIPAAAPASHVALARALYDAHRSAEALQELEGVIAESPRDASAWLLRGDIHQGEGRPAEAREAYQRFLELQPNGEQARIVRTILEREQQ